MRGAPHQSEQPVDTAGAAHWRLFISLLRPHRRAVGAYAVALGVATALPLLGAWLLARFVDLAVNRAPTADLVRVAGASVVVGVLSSIGTVTVIWRATALAWEVTDALRHDLADFVLHADLAFHREHTRGELVSRADDDVTAMAQFLAQFVAKVIATLALAVAAVVLLTILRPTLGPFLGVMLAIVGGLVWRKRDSSLSLAVAERDARGRASGIIEERVAGAEDIASLGSGAHSIAHFAEAAERVVRAKRRLVANQMRVIGIVRVALTATEVSMLVIGAMQFASGRVSIGTVFLGVRFTAAVRGPVEGITWTLLEVQGAMGSASRVLDLFASRPSGSTRTDQLCDASIGVAVEHVALVYDEDEGAVLDDVSVEVRPGRTLGVVGRSGSGKTSLGRLILGLLEPTSGEVRVGGHRVTSIEEESLRRHVVGVPQEVQLFPGTVRENITMFAIERDDDAVIRALRAVGLASWLDALPDGLDTRLFDRVGTSASAGMSAGEAQLLSLSRALIRNPSVVVLDEATSRVDPETQRRVTRAVTELLDHRTGVVIAHRLDTLSMCDDIVVLEAGRVVEHGERSELAADPASTFGRLLRLSRAGNVEATIDDLYDVEVTST